MHPKSIHECGVAASAQAWTYCHIVCRHRASLTGVDVRTMSMMKALSMIKALSDEGLLLCRPAYQENLTLEFNPTESLLMC